MATIEAYQAHLYRVPIQTLRRLGTKCIDGRVFEPGVQFPSGDAGIINATYSVLRDRGIAVARSRVAETVLRATGSSLEHDGVCGGDKARPRLSELYASTDPASLYTSIGHFGLNLPENTVAHSMDKAIRFSKGKRQSNKVAQALDIRTEIAEAAQRLRQEGTPVDIRTQSVNGRRHVEQHVLSITGPELFDAESAWENGAAAYAITWGALAAKYGPFMALFGLDMDSVFARMATDVVLTAQSQLRVPDTDRVPEILTV